MAGGSDGKESASNAGDLGSISGLGISPGAGHDNALQYSCLETPRRQSMGLQGVGHDCATEHSTHFTACFSPQDIMSISHDPYYSEEEWVLMAIYCSMT